MSQKLIKTFFFFISILIFESLKLHAAAEMELEFYKGHPSKYTAFLFKQDITQVAAKVTEKGGEEKNFPEDTQAKLFMAKSKKRKRAPWEEFIEDVTGEELSEEEEIERRSGALLLIPVGKQTISYVMGGAGKLVPAEQKVHNFGLKILAAKKCGVKVDKVKRTKKRSKRRITPLTTIATSAKATLLESFGIDPLDDETQGLKVQSSISGRLEDAGDEFTFRVKKKRRVDDKSTTLKTLEELAPFLKDLYEDTDLNPALAHLRNDSLVEDETVIAELNTLLENQITLPGHPLVHVYEDEEKEAEIVSYSLNTPGTSSHDDLFDLLSQGPFSLDTEITTEDEEGGFERKKLLQLLTTAPFPLGEAYYYFDRGKWKFLAKNTVEEVRKIMEATRIQDNLGFPLFNRAIDRKMKDEELVISENVYNKRVYEDLKAAGKTVFLLDCKNIKTADGKGQLEFSDLIVEEGGETYFLHVKRGFEGESFSHLNYQIAAAARFLGHDFEARKKIVDKILKSAVESVLNEYGGKIDRYIINKGKKLESIIDKLKKKKGEIEEEIERERNRAQRPRRGAALSHSQVRSQDKDEITDLIKELEKEKNELDQTTTTLNNIFGENGLLSADKLQKIHFVLVFIDEKNTGKNLNNLTQPRLEHMLKVRKEISQNFHFNTMVIESVPLVGAPAPVAAIAAPEEEGVADEAEAELEDSPDTSE